MLPLTYGTAAAYTLAIGGLLACFAGYRLFRVVLGIFGLLLGAFIATSFVGTEGTTALVIAAIAGGVLGTVLMVVAYYLGIGLVGAGLAALVINLVWRFVGGEPPVWLLVIGCVVAALGAITAVRFVVIFGTAIVGAWTLILGALAIAGDPSAQRAASAGDVWVLYPLGPNPGELWQIAVWFALSVAGAFVQVATTKGVGRKSVAKSKTK
jgi:hypothetical protein